jgi:hypothetical protein
MSVLATNYQNYGQKFPISPSVFYALSALNGPMWGFSRCSANYHLGFTEPYDKMVHHGLNVLAYDLPLVNRTFTRGDVVANDPPLVKRTFTRGDVMADDPPLVNRTFNRGDVVADDLPLVNRTFTRGDVCGW